MALHVLACTTRGSPSKPKERSDFGPPTTTAQLQDTCMQLEVTMLAQRMRCVRA